MLSVFVTFAISIRCELSVTSGLSSIGIVLENMKVGGLTGTQTYFGRFGFLVTSAL